MTGEKGKYPHGGTSWHRSFWGGLYSSLYPPSPAPSEKQQQVVGGCPSFIGEAGGGKTHHHTRFRKVMGAGSGHWPRLRRPGESRESGRRVRATAFSIFINKIHQILTSKYNSILL